MLCIAIDPGLKSVFESIDNRNDFKTYMQNFAVLRGGARNRRDTFEEGFVSEKEIIDPDVRVVIEDEILHCR